MADAKMTFPVHTNWASATRLRGWRPVSSTSFYWCCQISAADFFACFFVWWFSPSSRSSCAYLWSLIKCGSLFFCLPTMVHTVPKQLWQWNCKDIYKCCGFFCCGYICSYVGSVFFYFGSEGNFSPFDFFFFPLQQIKSGIHKNKFAALLFVSKFRIFCSVNIGDIICAITWNFNLISYCHISYI